MVLPQLGEVLAMTAGIGIVALADLSGAVTLHNFSAGPTYNAVIAGVTYGVGGAAGMFARVVIVGLLRRDRSSGVDKPNFFARLQ
jgi:hypothetical protein